MGPYEARLAIQFVFQLPEQIDGPRVGPDGGKMEPFVRHHNPRYVLETKSKIVYGDSDIPSVVLTCPVSAGEVQ